MTIDLNPDERDVAGLMWWWCEAEPWLQDVLLAEATLDFRTDQAERTFIEVLESHEDEWLQTLVDSQAPQERRAEAHAGMSLLKRLRR